MANRKTGFNTDANTYHHANEVQNLMKQNSLDEYEDNPPGYSTTHQRFNYKPSLPAPNTAPPAPLPKSNRNIPFAGAQSQEELQ